MGLHQLEHDAAVPVDDRLRLARRAGAEEHEDGVVERNRLERELPGLGEEVGPRSRVGHRVLGVGDVDDVLERGEGRADQGELLAPVEAPVAEAVAADREQDLRPELPEAVDHATGAELGRNARPDRSEARSGGERNERLGDVREVRGDEIALADAEAYEPCACPGDLVAQLAEGQLERGAGLTLRDDRNGICIFGLTEQVLGEVERRTRKPARCPASPRSRGRARTARAP